jgi:DNA modification methylase
MGKRWDYDVPSVEVWTECLRVLKPGGHLLAFAGTRTQHRMAVRIEDAGFEIRDMIAWVYGSGFPKSLDVSKAIDKMDAAQEQQARRYRFTEWVRSTGITSKQIDDATQTNMGGHYTTAASQPAIMTREHLEACRHLLGKIPEWVEREADIRSVESKNFAEREVVGQHQTDMGGLGGERLGQKGGDITIAATPEAKQWEGWGTALKPALEPITVARKPLIGTVAENVLQHGTGAINVDGGRVGTEELANPSGISNAMGGVTIGKYQGGNQDYSGSGATNPLGRWPANFIHDGSEEVVGLFPQTTSGAKKPNHKRIGGYGGDRPKQVYGTYKQIPCDYPSDSGSAARFFYCAKASKADRGENHHPTVKPTDLMRYLCRLVTPPGGIVLDPFMGSGSTGKAAMLEGFAFVGIEREAEYIDIAKARIQSAVGLL